MGLASFLLAAGAAGLVIGPRELPVVARRLGRALGQAVALVRAVRVAVAEEPTLAAAARQVEQGLADVRRIRSEVQLLRTPQAQPYFSPPSSSPTPAVQSPAPSPAVQAPSPPSPPVQPLPPQIVSPSYTDGLRVPGGADLLLEVVAQRSAAAAATSKARNLT